MSKDLCRHWTDRRHLVVLLQSPTSCEFIALAWKMYWSCAALVNGLYYQYYSLGMTVTHKPKNLAFPRFCFVGVVFVLFLRSNTTVSLLLWRDNWDFWGFLVFVLNGGWNSCEGSGWCVSVFVIRDVHVYQYLFCAPKDLIIVVHH